jgi:hypothetical protein
MYFQARSALLDDAGMASAHDQSQLDVLVRWTRGGGVSVPALDVAVVGLEQACCDGRVVPHRDEAFVVAGGGG